MRSSWVSLIRPLNADGEGRWKGTDDPELRMEPKEANKVLYQQAGCCIKFRFFTFVAV